VAEFHFTTSFISSKLTKNVFYIRKYQISESRGAKATSFSLSDGCECKPCCLLSMFVKTSGKLFPSFLTAGSCVVDLRRITKLVGCDKETCKGSAFNRFICSRMTTGDSSEVCVGGGRRRTSNTCGDFAGEYGLHLLNRRFLCILSALAKFDKLCCKADNCEAELAFAVIELSSNPRFYDFRKMCWNCVSVRSSCFEQNELIFYVKVKLENSE